MEGFGVCVFADTWLGAVTVILRGILFSQGAFELVTTHDTESLPSPSLDSV